MALLETPLNTSIMVGTGMLEFQPLSCQCSLGLQGTREQWQTCFYISAGAYLLGWLMFTIFAKAEEQEWAKMKDDVLELEVKDNYNKEQVENILGS